MSWRSLLFGFQGRIDRARWWIGSIIVSVVAGANTWLNRAVVPDDGITTIGPGLVQLATFVIGVALLWPAVAVSVKRWHDRNKSGWWMFIVLLPIVGGLWALVELGFLSGSDGANDYGPEPSPGTPG